MPDNNFIPWDDIVASPKFQGLEPAQKRKVMNVWVKENLNTSEKFNALDAGRQTHIIKSLEHQAGLSVAGYTPQKQTQVTGLTIGDIGRASEDVAMGKPVVAGERNREAIKTVEEQPEATWGEIFKSIPESAVNQTAQGFGGIAQAIGEGLKLPKVAQWGRDVYQGTEQIQQELTPNIKSGLKGNVYGAGVSVLQNLMTLPLSIITGSPAPTLAIMGMTAGGQGYGEAREKGLDVGKSLAYGTSMGGSEVVTEWSPMSTLLKPGISLGKRLFTEALQEVFGENVNTVHQHITKQLAFNPNATVGDFLNSLPQQIKDTTYQTLLSSPLLAGASHLVVGGETKPKPLYDTPKDFTGETIQEEGEATNKGLQLQKPEVDLPPGYTPATPTTEEKPFTPEEDIRSEGEIEQTQTLETPNKGLNVIPQSLPEAPKTEEPSQVTPEQPQEQTTEKPPGFIPIEKAWSSTREEESAEWDKAVEYIQNIEKQLQPQIDELQGKLKAIKGKSPVKQKLQQQIRFLEDKSIVARKEYDEAATERSLVIAEQAKQKLTEQGFTDEETIQHIVDDFLVSSGFEAPYYEMNHNKTLEQLLEEAVQRKLQSDLIKEEEGGIQDGEGVQGGDEGGEGVGVSQDVQRGEEVTNEEIDAKLLPNKAGTFKPSKPTLPAGLRIEKEKVLADVPERLGKLPGMFFAMIEKRLTEVLDVKNNSTGWKSFEDDNGVHLVNPTTKEMVSFGISDKASGSELVRRRAEAWAYAIDNPITQSMPEGEIITQPLIRQEEPTKDIVPSPEETVHAQEGTSHVGKEPSSGGVAPAVSKESWQMTKEEYIQRQLSTDKEYQNALKASDKSNLSIVEKKVIDRAVKRHDGMVTIAYSEGKPVPLEVLKDYPDLQKPIQEKPIAEEKRLGGEVDKAKVIAKAYRELKNQKGFSSVGISSLQKTTGIPMEELKEFLKQESKEGRAVLSTGDWSLASPEERQGAIYFEGETDKFRQKIPHLLVKFIEVDKTQDIEKPSTKVYTSKKKGGGKNVRVEKPGADSQVEGSEKLEGDVPETPTEERPNTVPQAGEHGDSGSGDQRSGGAGVEPSVTGNTGVDVAGKDEGAGGGDSEGVGAGGTSERTGRERGLNYRINTQDDLGGGTPKKAFGDNVEAVKLLKKIESENRKATADEQKILAKYVGWGGMPGAFRGYGDWRNEYDVLKNLLTEQEWDEAKGSTLNAHYTSAEVIKNIYHFVEKMGFKGGYILEPSAGIGNFIGLLPENIAKNSISKVTGIELDSISGRIAKQLYQDANIIVSGFENVNLPDDFYDLAISNVPFGDYKLYDTRYNRYGFNIHDYFFAKSIDKVKPGGLLVFITSRFTMDKKDQKVRKYLSDKADFIGAVRLPYTAFKGNANTEVVTDIVILRKKDAGSDSVHRKEWLGTVEQPLMKYDKYYSKDIEVGTFHLNEYYVKNPDMMFGRMMGEGSMYRSAEPTLVPLAGESLSESFAKAESKIPANIMSSTQNTTTTTPVASAPTQRKRGTYYVQDGKIFMNDQEVEVKPIIANRIKGMIAVRDAANTLLSKESATNEDGEIAPEMKHLNAAYDSFVKKYGYIHSKANVSALKGDVEFPRLLALEKYDSDKGVVVGKADIFTKRLISKESANVKADSSIDALAISLAETGKVDLGKMSKLTGKSIADLQEELLGEIFLNPEGGKWESAEEYLSGNVVAKLEAAEAAVKIDAKYRFNVESLKKVQPEPLTERDIIPKLGASWVDVSDIETFIKEILNTTKDIKVSHSPEIGFWAVESQKYELQYNTANTNEWGLYEYPAIQLIDDALNGKTPTILKKINVGGEVQVVVDTEKTEAAKDKQNKIKEKFKDWLWTDAERTARTLKKYNRERNNLRERAYTAPKFTFPGMSAVWKAKLNKHQLNVIWRVIQSPTTLLAHTVGAGKTATMVAAAMELKRLGIVRKPMFVVPKHLIEQFAAEFLNIYPHARILTAGAEDFTPKNRGVLMSNISTNDWDAVVVGHTSFGKLPISQKHINDFIKEQIEAIEFAIEALGSSKQKGNRVVKQLQAAKKRLEFKVKEVGDKQDNVINFEELGVDQIFIDEAHKFKNLYMATKMTRVAGVPATESQRSFDMYVKTQYLINKYGRGVVFATGTPISNSMSELFTMQRYLQSKTLKENGLHHFDTWAGDYGNIVTSWEVSPDGGGFRTRTRFAQFINVPELIGVFKQVADIQTAKMLKLPKPDLKGGRAVTISAEASPELKEYVTELVKRSEEIRSGKVDKRVDNMLKVTTDGMKAALDMRLVNPALPDNPNSKVNMSVNNIIDIWNRTKPDRSTQLLFIDRSVPQEGVFNVYDDIIAKLKQGGIPKDEIAVIHDYDTDEAKTVLFGKVRSGSVRVLLGSTAKMGEGMNVQDKLIALHHLDAPWKPTDIEQREGRILRRGNKNKEVEIYNYITKGSFDAYMWQVLEVKARFIAQIMTGDAVARSVNDVDDTSLTYAEVKALASANPLTLEKLKADKELLRLERLKAQHNNEQYDIQRELGSLPAKVQGLRNKIKKIDADIKQRNIPEEFSITIKGKVYADRKEAGQVILGIAKRLKTDEEIFEAIGKYAGLDIHIKKSLFGLVYLEIGNAYPLKSEVSDSDTGTIIRLDNTAKSFEKEKEYIENELAVSTKRLADLEGLKGKTFEYETELLKAMKHVQDLTSKLDLDKSDANSGDDDGTDDDGGNDGGGLSGDDDAEQQAFNPDSDFRRNPVQLEKPVETTKRSEIVKLLQEKLDIPIRTGRFKGRALGIFKRKERVIRTKFADDIETISHELGHDLQEYLWGKRSLKPLLPFKTELLPIATKPKGGQSKLYEGFAEFIRLYITDNKKAQSVAPEFYKAFDIQLQEKLPEVRKILLEARDRFERYISQSPEQRKLSQISINEKGKEKGITLQDIATKFTDELTPLKNIVSEITQGEDVPVIKDPYKLARLMPGVWGKADAFLEYRPFNFKTYKFYGKSLGEILRQIPPDRLNDYRSYQISKSEYESYQNSLKEGGKPFIADPISIQDAKYIIDKYESEFGQVFKENLAYREALLQYLRDSGILGEDTYEKFKELYKNYVPLYRVMETEKGLGVGRGLEAYNPIRSRRGSWRDFVDPIESDIKNTYLFITLAEKNAVTNALVDLANSKQGMGKYVEKIPYPTKKILIQSEEILQQLSSDPLFSEILKEFPDLAKTVSIFRKSAFVPKENVISVWKDGEQNLYQVHPDIARTIQSLDSEEINTVIKILSYPSSWLRAGAILSPEFLGRNPFRDQYSAFVYSEYGYVPGIDLARGIYAIAKKTEDYWKFKISGAEHSMFVSLDRTTLQKQVNDVIQGGGIAHDTFSKAIKNPIELLRVLSEFGEMGTRIGEFKKGLQREGETKAGVLESAMASRELALDYARKGSLSKVINMLVAFWNASIQGSVKLYETHKEEYMAFPHAPKGHKIPLPTTFKALASITIPSIILAILNYDDDKIKEVPQWQKDLFWLININGTIIRIPKPFELGIIYGTLPERIVNYIMSKDKHAFDNFLHTFATGALPSAIPTVMLPLMENWANKNYFLDRPIVPRGREGFRPEYQYQPYTTELAKEIGRLLSTIPYAGETSLASPAKMENLIQGWTGGLGKHILNLADYGLRKAGVLRDTVKPTPTLSDIPFIKGFVVRYPASDAKSVKAFYDNYNRYIQTKSTARRLAEEHRVDRASDLLEKENPVTFTDGFTKAANTYHTALGNISDFIQAVYNNPQIKAQEKRQLIDNAYLSMIEIAQNGNALFDD